MINEIQVMSKFSYRERNNGGSFLENGIALPNFIINIRISDNNLIYIGSCPLKHAKDEF